VGAGTINLQLRWSRNKPPDNDRARNVFVGSDSTLVAPLAIADGRAISQRARRFTEDVPADALALGRARQTIKPDWAKKMRSRKYCQRIGFPGLAVKAGRS